MKDKNDTSVSILFFWVVILFSCVVVLVVFIMSQSYQNWQKTQKIEEVRTTYWEAVNLSPIHTGKEPPTKWRIEIKNAENAVVLDRKIREKVEELIKKYPGYNIDQMEIVAEITVVIGK